MPIIIFIPSSINAENRLVQCTQTQRINRVSSHATLLVISPDHGSVSYSLEKIEDYAFIPSDSCVVYVKSVGMYQCTVGEDKVQFEVKGINYIM